jgi:hypothetical protein
MLVSLIGLSAYGQEAPPPPPFPALQVSLPLLDMPFNNFDGHDRRFVTSMRQSTELSKSFYQVTYPTLVRALGLYKPEPGSPERLGKLALFATYLMGSSYLPLGDIWLHEEYHRAVLKNRGIDSHDNVYDLTFDDEATGIVSHVQDEDLILFKKKYPYDLIRSHAAGYEGDNQLVSSLIKDAFFLGTSRADWIVWLNVTNDHFYIRASTTREVDTDTNLHNSEERTIQERDFTGFDFTAWVYDLHRPEEDYAARGVHPSGVGIDRYIKLSDLTTEEIRYLKKQRDLSLFNIAGLFLMKPHKVRPFSSGDEFSLVIRPIHYLTSFGYTVNADFFLKKPDLNLVFSLQNQFNDDHYFPGVDMEMINYPYRIFGKEIAVTPRLSVWSQPKDQNFRTSKSELGGLVSLKTSAPLKKGWSTYLELEGKTKGWVAGNVYLDDAVSARTGVTLLF